MNKTKSIKGITLVALVITIIVLLILAVVAIGAVRDSGIIGHAQNSADKYNTGKEGENLKLKDYEDEITKYYNSKNNEDNGADEDDFGTNGDNSGDISTESSIDAATMAELEKYIFGQELNGRLIYDIVSIEDPNLYTGSFLDDDITPINEKDKVIYSDTGLEEVNDQELLIIYFKYENEFLKFAINMSSGNTDVNYGLVKLPKVDTSNYTALEKYMLGEHGQGRNAKFIYNDGIFINHSTTIPNASTKLIALSETNDILLYFKYEDETYKVLVNPNTYNIDKNHGVVKLNKLEQGTKVGKTVEYDGAKWTILYDDSINGLQMIRNNNNNRSTGVASLNRLIHNEEEMEIADLNLNGNIDTKLYGYNMAIELLNKACEEDVAKNENIIEVRCVGSNPINKNSENSERYTSDELKEWPTSDDRYSAGIYNGKAKSTDQNFISDYERMLLLGIADSDNEYWLASRFVLRGKTDYVNWISEYINFDIRICDDGDVRGVTERSVGKLSVSSQGAGSDCWLRPVVKLKPNTVLSGSGTDANPYTF